MYRSYAILFKRVYACLYVSNVLFPILYVRFPLPFYIYFFFLVHILNLFAFWWVNLLLHVCFARVWFFYISSCVFDTWSCLVVSDFVNPFFSLFYFKIYLCLIMPFLPLIYILCFFLSLLSSSCFVFQHCLCVFLSMFNPFKPSVIFVGHKQTAQTQIRRHRLWRLIRVSTVCLHNALLKSVKSEKYHPTPL